jgi:hypothetical protein
MRSLSFKLLNYKGDLVVPFFLIFFFGFGVDIKPNSPYDEIMVEVKR